MPFYDLLRTFLGPPEAREWGRAPCEYVCSTHRLSGRAKKEARIEERLSGVYVPFWTYDAKTDSAYSGQRGDDYWRTESYTVVVEGKAQTRTRQVRQTQWSSRSGNVDCDFDDILILASSALPREYTDKLEPWDLDELRPFEPEYLSGFTAQSYQIDLPEGFALAQEEMDMLIRKRICRDIGGDHQQISSVETEYDAVTFKHLLLPVWVATYRYQKKVYRFLINARTGEVQGEWPRSKWKIALVVVIGLVLAFLFWKLWVLVVGAGVTAVRG